MEYAIYKLRFTTGVHIGESDIEDSSMTIHADTIFSALCIEALKVGGQEMLDKFYNMTKSDRIRISDALPYKGSSLYVPKPVMQIKSGDEGNSADKKQFKKMKYIPVDMIEEYVTGRLDAKAVNDEFKDFGRRELRTLASIKGEEETRPYRVGLYHFEQGCGLYIIAGCADEESRMLTADLLESLQYDGIGGKRSSGMGKFELLSAGMPETLKNRLGDGASEKYMTLSVCMSEENELKDILNNASYTLVRRGGFAASGTYAPEPRRKKDMYLFAPGSVFEKTFSGDVFDVSAGGGHPVYRYAKPVWLEVKQ
jgi:CRISPR-associated protein Csm4